MSVLSSPLMSLPDAAHAEVALTPRSRVRVMLAAMDDHDDGDDDSEKEDPDGGVSKLTFREKLLARTRKTTPEAIFTGQAEELQFGHAARRDEGEDFGTDDEESVLRPRGRMAASMKVCVDGKDATVRSGTLKHTPRRIAAKTPPLRQRTKSPLPDESCSAAPSSVLFHSSPAQTSRDEAASGSDSNSPHLPPPKTKLQELIDRRRQERLEKERAAARDAPSASNDNDYDDNNDHITIPPVRKSGKRNAQVKTKKHRANPKATEQTEDRRIDSEEDGEASKKMTQAARPTRKASKKALDEMRQETERMRRNMQLTLAPVQKKKFSVSDFVANFKSRQSAAFLHSFDRVQATTSSSILGIEESARAETPSSSPPGLSEGHESGTSTATPGRTPRFLPPSKEKSGSAEQDDDLPELNDVLKQLTTPLPPPTSPSALGNNLLIRKAQTISSTKPNICEFAKSKRLSRPAGGSVDDLEVVIPKPNRFKVFDDIAPSKAQEPRSVHVLRALAHLNAHERGGVKGRPSMSYKEMQLSLQARARRQAVLERAEKLQALRDKGIVVVSGEEREKDQLQLEDMLTKARKEAYTLRLREQQQTKKDGKAVDEADALPSDDEDDSWHGSEGEQDSDDEIQGQYLDLSGSDSEEDEDDVNEDVAERNDAQRVLFDEEADEEEDGTLADGDEVLRASGQLVRDASDVDMISSGALSEPDERVTTTKRKRHVITSDDEDADTNVISAPKPAKSANVAEASPHEAFGFAKFSPSQIGLSQVFAGTMAMSQTQEDTQTPLMGSQQDSLAFLREPAMLHVGMTHADVLAEQLSQERSLDHTQGLGVLHFDVQSQLPEVRSQMSEIPDPTQDVGFQPIDHAAARTLTVPYSTVDTMPLRSDNVPDSPVVRKKERGRLIHRAKVDQHSERPSGESDDDNEHGEEQTVGSADAFAFMLRAAQRPSSTDPFNKRTSRARGMIEEQAEESDDEYAGLGGASDDESHGEIDEEIRALIDDESTEKLNEGRVAALFADKERADDEARVARLYKDIHSGALRRKRGAGGLDLDDDDDEDEAAARRRAAKQREFARMRLALLADEKLERIAANPKQQAFLQAIEDRDEDDEIAFLDGQEETSQNTNLILGFNKAESPPQSQSQLLDHLLLPLAGDAFAVPAKPVNPRRKAAPAFTRPTTLAAIRTTLSELIGEPDPLTSAVLGNAAKPFAYDDDHVSDDERLSDDEPEHQDKYEQRKHQETHVTDNEALASVHVPDEGARPIGNARRVPATSTHVAVVDRMALRRAASHARTLSDADMGAYGRLAFSAAGATESFTVPSLLRRATTNASTTSGDSQGDGSTKGLGHAAVRMGGSKKSSVNYHVRELERRRKGEEAERVRDEGRRRIGEMRRTGGGAILAGMAGGSFG